MGFIGPIPRQNGFIVIPYYICAIISNSVTCFMFQRGGFSGLPNFGMIASGAKRIFYCSHYRISNFCLTRRKLGPLTFGARTKGSIVGRGTYIRGVIIIYMLLWGRFLILCTFTFSHLRVFLAWSAVWDNCLIYLWRFILLSSDERT